MLRLLYDVGKGICRRWHNLQFMFVYKLLARAPPASAHVWFQIT